MLDVRAQLVDRSTFLAGERIECHIIFTNSLLTQKNRHKNKPLQLAWASAQIHCQCTTSEYRLNIPKTTPICTDLGNSATATSFVPGKGEKGHTVLATKPIILFCDLDLISGESRAFIYNEVLSSEAPPSYRGNAIKYAYKITIGVQPLNKATELIRLPFRVLTVPGLNDISVYNNSELTTSSNPFRKQQQEDRKSLSTNILDIASQVIQNLTHRRTTNFYNITNSRGKVAKFSLFKQAFRIGDDIVGTFDFSIGTVPCVKIAVSLQTEEILPVELQKKNTASSITTHCRQQIFCLDFSHTHVTIPIPLTATPEFVTELVHLKWKLHFEFITSIDSDYIDKVSSMNLNDTESWQAPECMQVETMVWDLPIKVLANNPNVCSLSSNVYSNH